jgi:hypothetical protein
MKQTAVEWLFENLNISGGSEDVKVFEEALEMEKKQIFKAKNVSAKEAYEAGQFSMYCGCYEIDGCTNYEEWLYKKFKSE